MVQVRLNGCCSPFCCLSTLLKLVLLVRTTCWTGCRGWSRWEAAVRPECVLAPLTCNRSCYVAAAGGWCVAPLPLTRFAIWACCCLASPLTPLTPLHCLWCSQVDVVVVPQLVTLSRPCCVLRRISQ